MDFIKDTLTTVDLSDPDTKRTKIVFPDGYKLSIIQGPYTYGGSSGLYGIALFNASDEWGTKEIDSSIHDDVIGYLSESGVCEIIDNLIEHHRE